MSTRPLGGVAPFVPRGPLEGRGRVPAVVKSRLMPPRLPMGLIGIDKASRWVEPVLAHDITLISAPLAYGKTVLAARIYHDMRDAGFDAAWVSCTDDDIGADAHIVHALLAAMGADGRDVDAAAPPATAAALLANRICDHEEPLLLCLDAADRVAAPRDVAFVGHLICNCPTNLHLLLTARKRTAAIQGWVDSRPSVQAIGAAALTLSDSELAGYLGAEQIVLSPARLRAVNAAIAGWWGGAREVRRALAGGDWQLPADAWDRCCAEWSALLFERVLDELDAHDGAFLAGCAVAPIVSPALAAVLSGASEAQARVSLLRLGAAGAFVEPQPGRSDSYRLHPGFRSFLLAGLAASDPAAVRQLRRGACTWLAQRGAPIDAIATAMAGDDDDLLADAVAGQGPAAIETDGPALVRCALGRLGADRTTGDERLARAAAWVGALDGADERPAPDDPPGMAARVSAITTAAAAARQGDRPQARHALAPVLHHARRSGAGYIEALALVAAADGHRAQGHPAEAERVLRDGRAHLADGVSPRSETAAVLAIALADCRYQQNDLAPIDGLIAPLLPLLPDIGDNETVLRGFRVAIRLSAAQGRLGEAMAHIERVEDVAASRGWAPLNALAAVERMRIRAPLITPLEDILPIVREDAAIADTAGPAARQFAILAEARAYEAIQALDRPRLTVVADRVLRLAERLNDMELRVTGTLLHVLPQLSGRCDRMVEIETATFLNDAAAMGIVRTMVDLLDVTGVRTSQDFNSSDYAAGSFLGLLRLVPSPGRNARPSAEQRAKISAFSFLTARELEIVAALGSGETNKMIARKLGLTPETIKWHMKSLMRKLRASTRDEVVSNARRLGLSLAAPACPSGAA